MSHLLGCAAVGGRPGLALDLGEVGGVVCEVGEDHALLVVVLAEDLVVAEEEPVAHAEPAWLTRGRPLHILPHCYAITTVCLPN